MRVGLAGGRKHGQEDNACSHEGGNSEEGETDHVSSGEVLQLLNFLHSFRVGVSSRTKSSESVIFSFCVGSVKPM